YLPALLTGLAAALTGRSEPRGSSRSPVVLAVCVAAAGALAALDAIFPEHHATLLTVLAPSVHPLARALAGPLALALVAVSFGLARGLHRAWQIALVLLLGQTVLHILHSDYGAVVTSLLALALVARRHAFSVRGDPAARPRLVVITMLA